MPNTQAYNRFNSLKILAFSDRIWQIVNGGLPYPIIWHIYPCNLCHNDCEFCIMAKERANNNGASLNSDVLYKAVDEAKKYGARTIHFSGGGEPLLHPNITLAMRKAKALGLKIALSTNGIDLKDEQVDLVDFPRISLDAATAGTYFKTKRSRHFDIVIDKIEHLPKNLRSKLGLGFVASRENWHETFEFCGLAAHLGVGWVHIRPAYYHSDDIVIGKWVDTVNVIDYFPAVQAMAQRAREVMNPAPDIFCTQEKFEGYWTPRSWRHCKATPLLTCLKANGKFVVCQDRTDLEFGDYNIDDFWTIWFSEAHKKALQDIREEDCPRCVETKKNEYIQKIFIEDACMMDIQ